jgi:hypothetical protein
MATLFRVRGYALNAVGVAFDREIEPPILADTSLPEVLRFAVLLGTQGWVMEVPNQEARLFQNGALNVRRSIPE